MYIFQSVHAGDINIEGAILLHFVDVEPDKNTITIKYLGHVHT